MDLKPYLQPISPQQPEGESLRYSPIYDEIREAMRAEDGYLPQGVWKTDIKKPDWPYAVKLCDEALRCASKDLQIAAWLLEGWTYIHGITGIRDGFELLNGLVETFWDTAYPSIGVDGDLSFRLSPFEWINEKLAGRMVFMPITNPTLMGDRIYTLADWDLVVKERDLQQDPRPASMVVDQVGASDPPTLQDLWASIESSDISFYKSMAEALDQARGVVAQLEIFLNTKVPEDPFSFGRVKAHFNQVQLFLVAVEQRLGVVVDSIEAPSYDMSNPAGEGIASPPMIPLLKKDQHPASDMGVQSRDQAYAQIQAAASYLAKVEPHSPVPLLIQRAVSWRDKSFLDLMNEMMQDPAGLADINRLLGLKAQSSGEKK